MRDGRLAPWSRLRRGRTGCRRSAPAAGRVRRRGRPPRRRPGRPARSAPPDAEQTSSPGSPPPRSSSTALNASTSPRSSPQKTTALAPSSSTSRRTAAPLCIPWARISITERPGSTSSSWLFAASVSIGSSRSKAASGSSSRRVCTATARPFSSTHAPTASASAQQPRQLADEGGQPARRLGRDHPAVGRGPALVAVLPEHEQLPAALADRVADLVEPAEGQHLAGRATGDHRDRAHLGGEVDEHLAARRGGCGPTRGRPRSAPGCRRSRGRRRGRRRRAPAAAYSCSPLVEPNSMDATVPAVAAAGAAGRSYPSVVVGEDHREPVEAASGPRPAGPCLMPRSRPSALRGRLERAAGSRRWCRRRCRTSCRSRRRSSRRPWPCRRRRPPGPWCGCC